MEHIEKRKLAKHVARLLRDRNVDKVAIGKEILRDFPEIYLDYEVEAARLLKAELGTLIVSQLQKQTDHPDAKKTINSFNLDLAINDYCSRKIGYFSDSPDQVLQLIDKIKSNGVSSIINDANWQKAIDVHFVSSPAQKPFLLGHVRGFSDSQLYGLVQCKDQTIAFDMSHPPTLTHKENLLLRQAARLTGDEPMFVILDTRDKAAFCDCLNISDWEQGNTVTLDTGHALALFDEPMKEDAKNLIVEEFIGTAEIQTNLPTPR